ncbi:MAG: helix-turn-helix domain-containing protein, partial [Candidatus Omnitrophica bacterium]|nr:helix-turn-helix domain-containing protein [Candidatus Omnitrophota bacterium]
MSKEPLPPQKAYLSIPEYARQLGISRIAVFKKVKQGLIPAKKVGRNYVIPTDVSRTDIQKAIQQPHISIPKLAKQWGISRIAVYQQVKIGKIKAEKIGRNYVIPVRDLTAKAPAAPVKPVVKIAAAMTIPELAKKLGISRIAVYQQVKSGKIKARKVGRNFVIEPQQLTGHHVSTTKRKKIPLEEYISLPECARHLGMSRFVLYLKIKKGEVKARKVGRNF